MIDVEFTAQELVEFFDGEAPDMVERARQDAARDMADDVPFYGRVFAPASDSALSASNGVPHWLAGSDLRTLEDIESVLADVTGTARDLYWGQADLCALAWVKAGPDASGALLKRLGHVLGHGAKTAERRVKLGLTFGPDMRRPDVALNTYLAALQADDPVLVMQAAIANGWNAAQVKQHIGGHAVTRRETLIDDVFEAADDAEEVSDYLYRAIQAAQEIAGLLEYRVRLVAVYEQEAA